MSIFSPRNFISPLTNTVNLVAIILVILLFAVFRFSAGRMNVEARNAALKKQREAQVEGMVPVSAGVQPLPPVAGAVPESTTSVPAVRASGESDLQKEIQLLTGGASKGGSDKTGSKTGGTAQGKDDTSLSDVEKALGIK